MSEATPPENARFSEYLKADNERQKRVADKFLNEKSLKITQSIILIAQDLNISPITLATAWSKQHDFVAATIIGARTSEQLDNSLAAMDLKLSAETMDEIDRVSK